MGKVGNFRRIRAATLLYQPLHAPMLAPPMRGICVSLTYTAAPATLLAVKETTPFAPRPPRLLDRVRQAIRARHYSRRNEKAYVAWVRRYILFHGKRHPSELGAAEITLHLSSLAVDGNVAASAQNQALSALLFRYREVLQQDPPWLDYIVLSKRSVRLPAVLTRDEVRAV